jgi:hypothetical protein
MRKRTLVGLGFFLSLVIVYGLALLEEERHEIGDSDIISLRPRRSDDEGPR